MKKLIRNFFRDDKGATMIEYALMVLLIATACVAAVASLGNTVLGLFTPVTTGF